MSSSNFARRQFLGALALAGSSCLAVNALAEPLEQPVYRVAKKIEFTPKQPGDHPLDPAIRFAKEGLDHIQADVKDYECVIIKRERVKGTLGGYEYMYAKIRNRKVVNGKMEVPLSVYLKFLKPESVEGREVIWVEGQNKGKLIAHEGGLLGRFSVPLDPEGAMAMKGNLYPITHIGIENLVAKLIERGEKDKGFDPSGKETEVEFKAGAKINKRPCTVLSVKHTIQRPNYDFELAQIFIDDEMKIPVRYVAYGWSNGTATGPVLEEYTYTNVKINQGYENIDFDPRNPKYNYKGGIGNPGNNP